jgi:hypothetical protein
MSSIVERWLSQDSQLSHSAARETQTAAAAGAAPKNQIVQADSQRCVSEKREEESQRDRESEAAKAAKVAKAGEVVVDARTASRGPCYRCGQPVHRYDGLRNWFGELVHHRCAGRAAR